MEGWRSLPSAKQKTPASVLRLDTVIAIGGDGRLKILSQLASKGNWQFIGIPKTIDNDVALTERSIGFDKAVNTITDALNRLAFTASSHGRLMIAEVRMGQFIADAIT